MRADATAMGQPSSLRFKVDGLDCQNEVRALREAVSPVVGGDDLRLYERKHGVAASEGEDADQEENPEQLGVYEYYVGHLSPSFFSL